MNTQRNRRYFLRKDLSLPMTVVGGIICAVIAAILIFEGMYSGYFIYYFGLPVLLAGIFLLIFANSYYVKDREIDDEVAEALAALDEGFRDAFTLSDRERDSEKLPVSGFIFDRPELLSRRGRDGRRRSNLFYDTLMLVTGERFYALCRTANLTDPAARPLEQRILLPLSQLTELKRLPAQETQGGLPGNGKLVLSTATETYTLYVPDDAMLDEAVARMQKKMAAH